MNNQFDIRSFFKKEAQSSSSISAPPGLSVPLPSVPVSSKAGGSSEVSSLLPTSASHVSYDTDSIWNDPEAKVLLSQPHTTSESHVAIALPPPLKDFCPSLSGKHVDWSEKFIVYVVKNGLIRAIDRRSGARTLFRGHQGSNNHVRDVSFMNRKSDILATVGDLDSGTGVLIWRLYQTHSTDELGADCLLALRCTGEASRIVWHPFDTNVLMIAHGKMVSIIESTKLHTKPSQGSTHVCQLMNDTHAPGQILLKGHHDLITDMSWSKTNVNFLLTSSLDGQVKAWDRQSSSCVWTISLNKSSITRCICMPSQGNGVGPFLVSSQNDKCTTMTLYSSTPTSNTIATPPAPSHVLDLFTSGYSSGRASFCVAACFPPHEKNLEPSDKGAFILVSRFQDASAEHPLLFVFHAVATKPTEFKFTKVTPFKLLMPVQSWSTGFDIRIEDNDEDDVSKDKMAFDITSLTAQTKAVQILRVRPGICASNISSSDAVGRGVKIVSAAAPQPDESLPVVIETYVPTDDHEDDVTELIDENEDGDNGYEDENEDNAMFASPPPGVAPGATPFANWLGAIAGGAAASAPPPPHPVNNKPVMKLREIPMPPSAPPVFKAQEITTKSSMDGAGSKLLTPTEMLKMNQQSPPKSVQDAIKLPAKKTNAPRNSKSPTPRSSTPTQLKKTVSTKEPKKKDAAPPPGMTQMPGNVKILKREGASAPPPPSAPPAPNGFAAPTPVAVPVTVEACPTPSLSPKQIEECISRAMTSFVTNQSKALQTSFQEDITANILTALESRSLKETPMISQAVATKVSESVKSPLTEAFYESMKEVMIPAFEAASQRMFEQVAKTVESHLSIIQQQEQAEKNSSKQMADMASSMTTLLQAVENLSMEVQQLKKKISAVGGGMQVPPGMQVPVSGQPQVMAGHLRSATPVDPFAGVRQEIVMHLSENNYELAFTKALSSSNPDMTKFCCRNADLSSVVGGDVRLSQPILLCILQHLGASLPATSNATVELEWMQEIAIALNALDPSIRSHVPQVLTQLEANIQTKLAQGDISLRRPLLTLSQVLRGISHR